MSRVRENSFKVHVDVNRGLEVSGDRLRPDNPSRKGRVRPLFWTSKQLSDRRIKTGNYEVERLVDHYKNDEGFPESENTFEPLSSFVHGYTAGFRNYLRAHPEIPVLLTDCLSKPDRVIEKDEHKPSWWIENQLLRQRFEHILESNTSRCRATESKMPPSKWCTCRQ